MKKPWLTITILIVGATGISYTIGSCKKHDRIINTTPLQQAIPAGFPAPSYTFDDNPLSEEAFQLGRKLFYDGRLSQTPGSLVLHVISKLPSSVLMSTT